MPALNVFELPRQPSLGELLGQGLGQGISQGVSSGVEQYQKAAMQQQKMSQLAKILGLGGNANIDNESKTAMDGSGKIGINQLLALEAAGLGNVAQILAPFAHEQQKAEIQEQKIEREKEGARKELAPASARLSEIIDTLGSQPGNVALSDELNTLGFWFTDKVYTHFNTGVINKEKFKALKNELSPNSNDRPETARAKLKSLNTIIGLDPNTSPKNFNKVFENEVKKVNDIEKKSEKLKSAEKESSLSEEDAIKILQEANGDPEQARKIARERGYDF